MKRFIIKALFYFIPFCCIYSGYRVFQTNISGDIGNLGKIAFGKEYNTELSKNYLLNNFTVNKYIVSREDLQDENSTKILTIGDSFSQQGIYGYQNYLAQSLSDSIINILRNGSNIETALSLLNSKIIDSSNCQILILEQVDRGLIGSLCHIDFDMQYISKKTKEQSNKNPELYNLCSWIRLQCGYKNPILKHDLRYNCFSHNRYSNMLFQYVDDLDFLETELTDIEKAQENLILLNEKFLKKGIRIIFLIAADKYDVYRPFMTDNSLPVDTTTDGFTNLPNVCVINTKPLLQEMVRCGEKDVYMVNDTHWSYKASEAVGRKLAYMIDSLDILK